MDDPTPLPPARAVIGRWTFERYVDVGKIWVGGGGALVLLLTLFSVDHTIVLGIELLFFLGLGWYVTTRHAQRMEALALGIMAGVVLGAVVGLGRFVLMPNTINALNVVTETVLTAMAAGLLTVSAHLLSILFIHHEPR